MKKLVSQTTQLNNHLIKMWKGNKHLLDLLSLPQKLCWWCRTLEIRHHNVALKNIMAWETEQSEEVGQGDYQQ